MTFKEKDKSIVLRLTQNKLQGMRPSITPTTPIAMI
jgi:hypothetical protein